MGSQQQGHHQHGSMDITHQQKTFAGFLKGIAWAAGVTLAVLVFLALVNA